MNTKPFKLTGVKMTYTDNDSKAQTATGDLYFFVCHSLSKSMYPSQCKEQYPQTTALFVTGEYKMTASSKAETKCWAVSQQETQKKNANPAEYKGGISWADKKVNGKWVSTRTVTSTPKSVNDIKKYPAPVITWSVKCDRNVSGSYNWAVANQGSAPFKTILLKSSGKAGCKESTSKVIYKMMLRYKLIIIPILIAFGVLFCYLGNKLYKYTLASIGFLSGFGLIFYLIAIFITPTSTLGAVFTLILALLVGGLCTYAFYKFEEVALILACKYR